MIIDTKFNVGECAYLIHENKVEKVDIENIVIKAKVGGFKGEKLLIEYFVINTDSLKCWIDEDALFKTKKEAVQEMARHADYKVCKDDLKETQCLKTQ